MKKEKYTEEEKKDIIESAKYVHPEAYYLKKRIKEKYNLLKSKSC